MEKEYPEKIKSFEGLSPKELYETYEWEDYKK